MRFLTILMIGLLVLPFAYAKEGSMKLLAVSEHEDGTLQGSIASLTLEVVEGKGRVFIDTYPYTKLDTQMSTRYANQIACHYLAADCSRYDFFYTIRADAPIVGGASASAALAVLTVAVLDDRQLNASATITGTMNSGGIIGPISGIKEKIEAAAGDGLQKVLIPAGQESIILRNTSIEVNAFAKDLHINVVSVEDLDQALAVLTDKPLNNATFSFAPPPAYQKLMQGVAGNLCNRSKLLRSQISTADLNASDRTIYDEAVNQTIRADTALSSTLSYTAASFCFGANAKFHGLLYLQQKTEEGAIRQEISSVLKNLTLVDAKQSDKTKETISELETSMVVRERLLDAQQVIEATVQRSEKNDPAFAYGYAIERLYSASSWMTFLSMPGKEFTVDEKTLSMSCVAKIAEAEERLQYGDLEVPGYFEEIKPTNAKAKSLAAEKDNLLCLFEASKAKAEADTIITSLGIEEHQLPSLVDKKLRVLEKNILRQEQKGIFPLLGYSYYEYASSLKASDPASALLYAEYALELTNIDLYLQQPEQQRWWKRMLFLNNDQGTWLVIGMILGIVTTGIVFTWHEKKPEKKAPKSPLLRKKR
ncbi:hypothetical protein HZB02_01430 [Candidatus Woesearchaeota archaeon]|nr:hypothetical protein [Candidatus Woesearchaeota archaeon]